MAALTDNTIFRIGNTSNRNASHPIAASSTVYAGGMVGLQTTGYCRALVEGDIFLGHSTGKFDNSSGSAGDLFAHFHSDSYEGEVTITSVAITDVGKPVYATDDNTYTLTTGGTLVGSVKRYVTTNIALVEFRPLAISFSGGVPITGGIVAREIDCETGQGDRDWET